MSKVKHILMKHGEIKNMSEWDEDRDFLKKLGEESTKAVELIHQYFELNNIGVHAAITSMMKLICHYSVLFLDNEQFNEILNSCRIVFTKLKKRAEDE